MIQEDPKARGEQAPGQGESGSAQSGAGNPAEGGSGDAPSRGAQAAAPASDSAAQAEGALAGQIQQLTAEKQDLMNTLIRRQADFENYRKRVEKERHQDRHRGVELLIEHLLPVLDAMDHALAHAGHAQGEFRKGVELIRRQLWDVLSKQGLTRIESVGKEFDPQVHHAIGRVESAEHAEGTVVEEMQAGYWFHERVLRPAMVRIAGAPADGGPASDDSEAKPARAARRQH